MNKSLTLVTILFLLTITFAASVMALPTPVAQWSFEEGTGTSVADTYATYNGTINNSAGTVTWDSGIIGDGLHFNNPSSGLGDYVLIDETAGNALEPTGDFAVEAWIKPGIIADKFFVVKARDWSSVYNNGYQLRTDGLGQKIMFYAGGTGSFAEGVILYDMQPDQWYHLVGVRDGMDNVLYLNGVEAGRVTSTSATNYVNVNPLMIGGLASGPGWTMDGVIDQVAIYDYLLSDDDVKQLYAQHLSGNEMSVEFFYNPLTDVLHTQGFAPSNTHSAQITFEDSTGATNSACVAINEGETPEFTYDFTPVGDAWELDTYNLYAELYDDTTCSGSLVHTVAGGEFDALRVIWIEDQLEQLNQTIQDLNASLEDNLTAVWDELNEIDADLDWVEGQIGLLWDALAAHNHATISLQHFDNESSWQPNTLRVWGEAPLGAEKFRVLVRLTDKSIYFDSGLGTVETNQQNENTYDYFVDLTDFDPNKYDILVKFYDGSDDWMGGYDVGDLFDDLYILWLGDWLAEHEAWLLDVNDTLDNLTAEVEAIHLELDLIWDEIAILHAVDEDLQNQIDALVDRVEALEESLADLWLRFGQIADFGMNHNQVDQELYIDGSGAPAEANWAKISVYTIDGNEVDGETVEVYPDGTFSHTFDIEEWPIEGMNIYVSFYETQRCYERRGRVRCYLRDRVDTIYDVWYGMLGELNYGFEHVEDKTWTAYYMTEPLQRPISYSVMPRVDGISEWLFSGGLYEIRLVSHECGEDISQVIEPCTWLNADKYNYLTSMVEIPEAGMYGVRLEAYKKPLCAFYFDEGFYSNYFPIYMHDLKDDLPEAQLTVISPEPNPEDVYWTNSANEFTLAGAVFLNGLDFDTQENPYCDIVDLTNSKRLAQVLPVEQDEEVVICSDELTMAQLHATNGDLNEEGVYEFQIELDAIGIDPTDTVLIGIDNTVPSINEIFPAEENIVSGTVTFTANISDDVSGVQTVWMTLTLKNGSVQWTEEAHYNETTGLWEVIVDTTQVPDGTYDITADAWDYAGNFGTLTIDPIIDNTAPEVQEILVSGFFGGAMTVDATITDNLAGVAWAQAEFWGYECEAWEDETCTLEWCEYVKETQEDGYQDCEEFAWVYESCALDQELYCEENWDHNDTNFTSYEECLAFVLVVECTETFDDCYDFCDIVGEATGYDSYDACIAGCTIDHCEWVDFGSWDYCEGEAGHYDESCMVSVEYDCSQMFFVVEEGFGSYEECVEVGSEQCWVEEDTLESCIDKSEEICQNWPDFEGDYDGYEDCMDQYCYSEYCEWVPDQECDDSSWCFGGDSGVNEECLDSTAEYCEFWSEGFDTSGEFDVAVQTYDNYEDCYEDQSQECYWNDEGAKDCQAIAEDECSEANGYEYDMCVEDILTNCYANYCDEFSQEYDEPTNFDLDCETNCYATLDCAPEDRINDTNVTEVVPLLLTSGDEWNGIWSGTATNLDQNKHYEVIVQAVDKADNENSESNQDESEFDFFAMLGYVVTLDLPLESTSKTFTASGTVVASDGSDVSYGTVTTNYGGKVTTPLLGIYNNAVNTGGNGVKTVVAEFRPYDECSDVVYTASDDILVNSPSGNGGSGGATGKVYECNNHYDDDGDGLVDYPEDPGCTSRYDDDEYNPAPKSSGTSGSDNTMFNVTEEPDEEAGTDEEPQEPAEVGQEPTGGEGITGAVVGSDGNPISKWFWVILALLLGGLVVTGIVIRERR